MGDEPDDEVPVDYSNQEEGPWIPDLMNKILKIYLEHSSTKNDVYSTENLENDETEIELTPKTSTKESNVIGLSDEEDDENNDDPEVCLGLPRAVWQYRRFHPRIILFSLFG